MLGGVEIVEVFVKLLLPALLVGVDGLVQCRGAQRWKVELRGRKATVTRIAATTNSACAIQNDKKMRKKRLS